MTCSLGFVAMSIAAAFTAAAHAGTYVESAMTSSMGSSPTPQTAKMWFDGARFRTELQQGRQVQIFKDKTVYALTPATQRYSKVDKASLEASMKKAKEATDKLYEMLPPEQREKMKSKSSAPAMEQTVKPTSRSEAAAGVSCKVYEVYVNGAKAREMCVAEVAALPNGKEIMSTMRTVSDAFKGTPAGNLGPMSDLQGIEGFPVITRLYMNGKVFQEMKVTTIRAAPTPESLFTIPAGFKEQPLDAGGPIPPP